MSRKRSIAGLTATIAALGICAFAASAAHACSCVGPDPQTGYAGFFEDADGAVIAKLVDVEPIGKSRTSRFTYRVREVFKKRDRFEVGERRRVISSSDEAACGIGYPVGSTHGVFLYRSGGRFSSSLCSTIGSKQMREAAEIAAAEPRVRLSRTAVKPPCPSRRPARPASTSSDPPSPA